jgi:hypothetical protein
VIDVTTPGSPGWWLDRLGRKLADRQPRLDRLHRYYAGDCDLPEGAEGCREAYRAFQAKSRSNFSELIVDAPRERMVITGFRTGAEDDENGDKAARDIFAANGLRVGSADLHSWMLSLGDAYTIVGPPTPETSGLPLITVEDPRSMVTDHDPRSPRTVRAALKMYTDDVSGRHVAYVYLPGTVHVAYRDAESASSMIQTDFAGGGWKWDESRGGESGARLPFDDFMPVTRFQNKRGVAEFEPHLDIIDRINHNVLQRMVTVAIQAYKQRAITGNLPETYADGTEVDYAGIFRPGPGALWRLPEGAEIWESSQADITGVLAASKDDVQTLAAVSRTPLHYITPDAANGSAEGASLMREGLVFKTEDRIERAKEGWAATMSKAFRLGGDETRAQLLQLEPLFAPVERYSLSERADAASKATDLSQRTRNTEIWQFPPELVERERSEKAGDALLSDALTPLPAVNDGTLPA